MLFALVDAQADENELNRWIMWSASYMEKLMWSQKVKISALQLSCSTW